jgi:NAD(P)H-hydrate epimerase
VIAGGPGTTGAALLATEATGRAGAGLTTLAATPELQPLLALRVLEAMTCSLPAADDGPALDALLAGRSAVVCGPGLGLADPMRARVEELVRRCRVALVLDADALNAVAGTRCLRERPAATVVTPHPGEMARLLGCDTATVQADRIAAARRFAVAEGVVTVLKGARTIIAAPDGRVAINPTGNPGMASGGMGDVLAGVIGGLLAQRLEPFEAACAGAYVHGAAGDAAATTRGTVGLLARDVLDHIPGAIRAAQASVPPQPRRPRTARPPSRSKGPSRRRS